MKLIKLKPRWTDDKQPYHLVEKTGWRRGKGHGQKLINFNLHTFCELEHLLIKNDEYVDFDRTIHAKKLCKTCYKFFKLRRRTK